MATTPLPYKQHIADIAAAEEAERVKRFARAWAAYDGEAPKPLVVEQGDSDDNVRLDYASLIVDKGVSFLAGKGGVTFQLHPPDEADIAAEEGDDPEQDAIDEAEDTAEEEAVKKATAALDAAWPVEQRHIDFHKLATNGGVCGHAWLRLYDDGRVAVLDPSTVSVEWDADDFEILKRYLITWDTVDEDGMGVCRRKRIEPNDPANPAFWTIYDEEHNDDANDWMLLDETAWQHPYAPVIGTHNLPAPNTFYGRADLEPATLDQIAQLEFVASNMRKIIRLHGHPIPVVTGIEAQDIRKIEVSVGEVLALPGKDSGLSQLQIAELTSSLALYQELKTALFESTHIPKVALGDTANAGPTTGVALQVEYEPLIERTETKHLTYGFLLAETARRILDLASLPNWNVALAWPELLPADAQTESLTDESQIRVGIVSRQTVSEARGYDWDVESQRIAEESSNFDAGTFTFTGGSAYGTPPPAPTPPTEPPPAS